MFVSLDKRGDLLDPDSGRKHQYTVTVSDSGPGISDADRENLFKPFFKSRD